LETLSPLCKLLQGKSMTHNEIWKIKTHTNIQNLRTDDNIKKIF
jgi:hypothetical protein